MASRPSRDELLAVIAEVEDFRRTLERFPALDRASLLGIVRGKSKVAPKAQRELFDPPPEPVPEKIEPQHHRDLIVWSDGASRGNPGPASIGVLITSADGTQVETISRAIGRATNNHAEYSAVLAGLRRARELGAANVEVRADSELAVRQLSGRYQVRSPEIRVLFEEVKRIEGSFPGRVRYRHVPREQNKKADALANLALDRA